MGKWGKWGTRATAFRSRTHRWHREREGTHKQPSQERKASHPVQMTGASIEADGCNRTWEQGTVSGVASLCSCLTHPRECAPGASGCVAGQPDWQRTVTETGSASNASLVLVMRLLQLMRSRLRVYRYALPSGATKPRDMSYNKGYSLEGAFDERLRSSQLLTSDATRAHLFYLPIHPIGCHMQKVNPRRAGIRANLRSVGSCAEEAARIMRQVGAAGPYLARRGGADHLWVSAHDDGKDYAILAPALLRSISLANSADVSPARPSAVLAGRRRPPFAPARDIAAVPCVDVQLPAAEAVLPPARRPTLAFFAGTVDNDPRNASSSTNPRSVRSALAAAFRGLAPPGVRSGAKGQWEDIRVTAPAVAGGGDGFANRPMRLVLGKLSPNNYTHAQRRSIFCLCPQGHAVWSPRLIESLLHGCIPVVLADAYWLPLYFRRGSNPRRSTHLDGPAFACLRWQRLLLRLAALRRARARGRGGARARAARRHAARTRRGDARRADAGAPLLRLSALEGKEWARRRLRPGHGGGLRQDAALRRPADAGGCE